VGSKANVGGFAGVPWGANKQQIAEVMAQKGFTLLYQIKPDLVHKDDHFVYRGTFVDKPADLLFTLGKNGLFAGEADLLAYRQQNSGAFGYVVRGFNNINQLLVMKYGPPDMEIMLGPAPNYICYSNEWTILGTVGTQTAKVTIEISGGYIHRVTTLLRPDQRDKFPIEEAFPLGIIVSYYAEIVSDPY